MLHWPGWMLTTGLPLLAEIEVGTADSERIVDCGGRVIVALNGESRLTVQASPVLFVSASVS